LGGTIEEVRAKVLNEDLIAPTASDFPLLIPGMCARSLLGLEPTPHAVLNVEPELGAQTRYSLVFFLVPREGVNAADSYIADEQELVHPQSGKTFLCRSAMPCDGPELAGVQVRSWQAAYRGLIANAYLQGFTVEQKARDWEKVLKSDTTLTLLAQEKDGQTIVGFATLGTYRDGDMPPDGLMELRALYIDPIHWRKGLGKKLTRLAMEECRRRKVGRLVLWVLESNLGAQKFYQGLGFQRDGGVKVDDRIEGCPLVEWRYSRSL
jgi:ribosomal protein S18 acetylase RimI-like enzyme